MSVENSINPTGDNKKAAPEKQIFRLMLVLAIATTVISAGIGLYEISAFPKPGAKKRASLEQGLPISVRPPFPPLNLLPDFIIQYATKGRQEVPGSKYPAAEAVYEKLDPVTMLATPVNTYAKATFFPSQGEAEEDIKEILTDRYPKYHEDLLLGNTIAKAGYDQNEGSYFIGWTVQSYSVKMYTSFSRTPPIEKQDILRNHALPLAKAIQSSAGSEK